MKKLRNFLRHVLAILRYVLMIAIITIAFFCSIQAIYLGGMFMYIIAILGIFSGIYTVYIVIKSAIIDIRYFFANRLYLKNN